MLLLVADDIQMLNNHDHTRVRSMEELGLPVFPI